MDPRELRKAWTEGERTFVGVDLCGADLRREHFRLADFTDADLSGVDFGGADLQQANLTRANLVGANLSGAALDRAHLVAANLESANLTWASLYVTNLTGASLRGAHLFRALLRGTKLAGASIAGTWFGETSLLSLDFSEVHGQLGANFRSPSSLSTDSLQLSRGRILPEFLRGCGFAEWAVESAKLYDTDLTPVEIAEIQTKVFELRARGPIQVHPVFISYSQSDASFVDALGATFDERGIRYWRDEKDATAGRLDKVIETGLALNPTLLVVLSEASIRSEWVQFEIERAIALSKRLDRDVLCPVMLDTSWLSDRALPGQYRAQLKNYMVLDFSEWRKPGVFAERFAKLVAGLGIHYR